MSVAHDLTSHAQEPEDMMLRRLLRTYAILDIAILESVVRVNKRAIGTFRSGRVVRGQALRYTNVEILGIGSSKGGWMGAGDGEDIYLVFSPSSSMPSTEDRIVDDDPSKVYSVTGMKALPLAFPGNWVSSLGFDRSGNLSLKFPGSNMTMGVDSSIYYEHGTLFRIKKNKDGSSFLSILSGLLQFFLMSDGSWYKVIWAGSAIQEMHLRKADGTRILRRWSLSNPTSVERQDLPSFSNFVSTETFNPDGSYTLEYRNSGGVILSDSVSATGKRTLVATGLELNAGVGKLKLATSTFNYSNWLNDLITVLQGIAVDPGSHVLLPAISTALATLATQLAAATE